MNKGSPDNTCFSFITFVCFGFGLFSCYYVFLHPLPHQTPGQIYLPETQCSAGNSGGLGLWAIWVQKLTSTMEAPTMILGLSQAWPNSQGCCERVEKKRCSKAALSPNFGEKHDINKEMNIYNTCLLGLYGSSQGFVYYSPCPPLFPQAFYCFPNIKEGAGMSFWTRIGYQQYFFY